MRERRLYCDLAEGSDVFSPSLSNTGSLLTQLDAFDWLILLPFGERSLQGVSIDFVP